MFAPKRLVSPWVSTAQRFSAASLPGARGTAVVVIRCSPRLPLPAAVWRGARWLSRRASGPSNRGGGGGGRAPPPGGPRGKGHGAKRGGGDLARGGEFP